jgi:hypothetical protein
MHCRLLSSNDSVLLVEPVGGPTQRIILYKDGRKIYVRQEFSYEKDTINFIIAIKKTSIIQLNYRPPFRNLLHAIGITNLSMGPIFMLLSLPSASAQYNVGNPKVTKKLYTSLIVGGVLYTASSIPAFIFGRKKKYLISTKNWATEKKYWKITSKLKPT